MRSTWLKAGAVGAVLVSSAAGVVSFAALGGAQTTGTTPIVNAGVDSSPAISDDGTLVVFQSEEDAGGGPLLPSIALHDRSDAALPVTELIVGSDFGVRPGISGDGCVIAWSVDATDPPPDPDDRFVVLDRCDEDGVPVDPVPAPVVVTGVAEIDAADQLGAPSLSFDGSAIAVSTGQEVLLLRETGGVYALAGATDGTAPLDDDRVTEDRVAITADGANVVFTAGPQADDTVRRILTFDGTVTSALLENATSPDISGDGTVLTAVQGTDVVVTPIPFDGAPDVLAAGARPAISTDGNHIVFDTADGVAIHSWTGADARPFAAVNDRTIADVATVTRSGPAIDGFGLLVATDTPFNDGDPIPDPDPDVQLTAFESATAFGAESYDLGTGEIGTELSGTLDVTNDGPGSFVIEDITIDGTFQIQPNECVGVLRAGTTCSFDVTFLVEVAEDAFADVFVVGGIPGTGPVVADVRALGVAPTTTTTTTTTTPTTTSTSTTTTTTTAGSTTGGSTTGGSTTGTTTGGSTTGGSTTGTTTGGSTTGSTTSSATTTTTTTTSTTTTTTLPPGSGLVVSPASFDFAPTIIEAGRRTGAIEVVNSAAAAATIESSSLNGDAAFTISSDGCSGVVLAEAERCTITIDFAPTAEGASNAQLLVAAAGGRELTASLTGTGARPPQLSVVPGSVQTGQVVTVRGAGFPTGITVELSAGGAPVEAVVDNAGSFAQPVVIMPNTSGGPLDIIVAGQQDLFGDVTTSVLIRATVDRSSQTILDGPGVNVGR